MEPSRKKIKIIIKETTSTKKRLWLGEFNGILTPTPLTKPQKIITEHAQSFYAVVPSLFYIKDKIQYLSYLTQSHYHYIAQGIGKR